MKLEVEINEDGKTWAEVVCKDLQTAQKVLETLAKTLQDKTMQAKELMKIALNELGFNDQEKLCALILIITADINKTLGIPLIFITPPIGGKHDTNTPNN